MFGDLGDVFDVADGVVLVDDEDRPAFDTQLGDQRAIGLAEGGVDVVAPHVHAFGVDGLRPAESSHGDGKVAADGAESHVGQGGGLLEEAFGLLGADRGVEGRHDAENPDGAGGVSDVDGVDDTIGA